MTAVNPQITKDYASGQIKEMFMLVCRGAKFSYFLLLLFAVPVIFEADYILKLWLKNVPEYAVVFLRLTIIGSMVNMLGGTGLTACMATGKIKHYSIWISSVGVLVFPLTWVAFKCGLPVESTYIIFIMVYIGVNIVRLYIMKGLLHFPPMLFIREVIFKICIVTLIIIPLPAIVNYLFTESFVRLILTITVSSVASCVTIFYVGLSSLERKSVVARIETAIKQINKFK